MNIYVDMAYMEELGQRLDHMQQRLRSIESRFGELESNLDPEIKKDMAAVAHIKRVKERLEKAAGAAAKYSEFMEETLEAYKGIEERLNRAAWNIQQTRTVYIKRSQADKSIEKAERRDSEEQRRLILTASSIKSCRLPEKESITGAPVKPGIIADGKNILIRTWERKL